MGNPNVDFVNHLIAEHVQYGPVLKWKSLSGHCDRLARRLFEGFQEIVHDTEGLDHFHMYVDTTEDEILVLIMPTSPFVEIDASTAEETINLVGEFVHKCNSFPMLVKCSNSGDYDAPAPDGEE